MERLIQNLNQDDRLLIDIGFNIWLMDNHKWAFYVWEKVARNQRASLRYVLIHIDYHFDDIDDVGEELSCSELLPTMLLPDIYKWTEAQDRPIFCDSFISPSVRNGRVIAIHWLCRQAKEDHGFDGVVGGIFVNETYHENLDELLSEQIATPYILDLDLDYFNDNEMNPELGPIWPEEAVNIFIQECAPLIAGADVVTIALSFGYSGTEEQTRRLATAVVPKILSIRQQAVGNLKDVIISP